MVWVVRSSSLTASCLGGHYFTVESSFIYHLEETAGGRDAGLAFCDVGKMLGALSIPSSGVPPIKQPSPTQNIQISNTTKQTTFEKQHTS